MNAINKQIGRARRRMLIGAFFRTVCWTLFAGLFVAAIAIAVPKIWHIEFLSDANVFQNWSVGWMIGGAATGLITAFVIAWLGRESIISAAVEVDKRYHLKERLSSAISLSDQEQQTDAGVALLDDAGKRADTIDVRDEFRFKPNWTALLPIAPVLICVGLLFVPNAVAKEVETKPGEVKKDQTKIAIEEARKKLKKQLQEMQAKGLKDAKINLDSLEKKIDNLATEKSQDKRDSLVKLNDIKKQLEDRRNELGGDAEKLKNKLKEMQDVQKGPGKQLSEALSEGDFDMAKKVIKDLAEKLKNGDLNKIEKKQLMKNMQEMADQIEDMVKQHEKKKQELQKKIDQAMKKGDMQQAAKLQQQLDRKKQQDKQMQKMQQMAKKMKACQNAWVISKATRANNKNRAGSNPDNKAANRVKLRCKRPPRCSKILKT